MENGKGYDPKQRNCWNSELELMEIGKGKRKKENVFAVHSQLAFPNWKAVGPRVGAEQPDAIAIRQVRVRVLVCRIQQPG